jgi:hypothetical protein
MQEVIFDVTSRMMVPPRQRRRVPGCACSDIITTLAHHSLHLIRTPRLGNGCQHLAWFDRPFASAHAALGRATMRRRRRESGHFSDGLYSTFRVARSEENCAPQYSRLLGSPMGR